MRKNNARRPDQVHPEGSEIVIYPEKRLLAGILMQSTKDLRSNDISLALDALDFWLSGDAALMMQSIGFSVDPATSFLSACKGKSKNAKKREKLFGS